MKLLKIESIVLQNVKSFRDQKEIKFGQGFNLLIGPNRGGKSNLLDIIVIVLRRYILYNWIVNDVNVGNPIQKRKSITSQQLFDPLSIHLEKFFGLESSPQNIVVRIKVTNEDINGLNTVVTNFDKLKNVEETLFYNSTSTSRIKFHNSQTPVSESTIEIKISNSNMSEPVDPASQNFLSYTRNYVLFSILIDEYNRERNDSEKIKPLPPLFQYFSPNRDSTFGSEDINLPSLKRYEVSNEFGKSTSKNVEKTWDFISFYLSMKMLHARQSAKTFHEDPEIKAIEEAMTKLGYSGIDVTCVDLQMNRFRITARIAEVEQPPSVMSSGEKEMLNILLSVYAFGMRNGLLIIDEPELHIHPTWQKKMLGMLLQIQRDRDLQMIIVTHSPNFVTMDTIENTYRVYREDGNSNVIKFNQEGNTHEIKDIYRMINTLGFQIVLFTDKVVLVEGQTDRIIFNSIIEWSLRNDGGRLSDSIEVIEAGGKNNFGRLRKLLHDFKVNVYTIADLDYILEDPKLSGCKTFDEDKAMEKLRQKNNKDGDSLFTLLDEFIKNGCCHKSDDDCKKLKALADYIKNRYSKIDPTCNDIKISIIEAYKSERIYILSAGEIEDYFPSEHSGKKFQLDEVLVTADKIANGTIDINGELTGLIEEIIS